jgi:hypothetical protein
VLAAATLLAGCSSRPPIPKTQKIHLGDVLFFKDDEFTQRERHPKLEDRFRVELIEELMLKGFELEESPLSMHVSFAVYSDLIRGETFMSEAWVHQNGQRRFAIRHNCAIGDSREAALDSLARRTADELADKLQR